MNLADKIKVILSESLKSPQKNSYVTEVEGKQVVLRESGNYKGLNLKNADLRRANLKNVDLENADLRGAILAGATFEGANLKNAKFDGAIVSGTDFTDARFGCNKRVLKGVKASIAPKGISIEAGGE